MTPPSGIDFGPFGSTQYQDYAVVRNDPYEAEIGYGWLNSAGLTGIQANRGNDLTRDKVNLRIGDFAIDVPNGMYDVDVVIGVVGRVDPLRITVEGFVDTFTPQLAPNLVKNYTATVTDGQLNFTFDGLSWLKQSNFCFRDWLDGSGRTLVVWE